MTDRSCTRCVHGETCPIWGLADVQMQRLIKTFFALHPTEQAKKCRQYLPKEGERGE